MPSVLIAGATGYLGRLLCAAYRARGYHVTALVRDRSRAETLDGDELIEALVSAKADFADALQASGVPSTVIAPSDYFSDMGPFLSMAQFFLTALALDMVGEAHGVRRLSRHFQSLSPSGDHNPKGATQ